MFGSLGFIGRFFYDVLGVATRIYRVQDSGFWEFFWLHVPESETEVLRVSNTAFSVFRLALSRFVVLESYWLVWRC